MIMISAKDIFHVDLRQTLNYSASIIQICITPANALYLYVFEKNIVFELKRYNSIWPSKKPFFVHLMTIK